jgi:outer membrane protein
MKNKLKIVAAAAMLALCAGAQAQSAGSWMLRAGATQITPHVSSGNLSAPSLPGSKADIEADTRLSGGVTWMATDNIAIDIPLALPFTHNINGAGAIQGVGKIGEVRSLPITAIVQYRFLEPTARFRPYVGAGPTYAKFYKERSTNTLSALTGGTPGTPTTLSIDSRLGLSLAVGGVFNVNDRWYVDAAVIKTFLKTRTTLSTGQTLDIKLDPVTLSFGVGYRF